MTMDHVNTSIGLDVGFLRIMTIYVVDRNTLHPGVWTIASDL